MLSSCSSLPVVCVLVALLVSVSRLLLNSSRNGNVVCVYELVSLATLNKATIILKVCHSLAWTVLHLSCNILISYFACTFLLSWPSALFERFPFLRHIPIVTRGGHCTGAIVVITITLPYVHCLAFITHSLLPPPVLHSFPQTPFLSCSPSPQPHAWLVSIPVSSFFTRFLASRPCFVSSVCFPLYDFPSSQHV